jgi:hypothetical protein
MACDIPEGLEERRANAPVLSSADRNDRGAVLLHRHPGDVSGHRMAVPKHRKLTRIDTRGAVLAGLVTRIIESMSARSSPGRQFGRFTFMQPLASVVSRSTITPPTPIRFDRIAFQPAIDMPRNENCT